MKTVFIRSDSAIALSFNFSTVNLCNVILFVDLFSWRSLTEIVFPDGKEIDDSGRTQLMYPCSPPQIREYI